MTAIAIDRDPRQYTTNWRLLTLGAALAVAVVVMAHTKLDLIESLIDVDVDGDGAVGDPNDPDECLTSRTMIQEIDADIQEYKNLMATSPSPFADAYYAIEIARLEVEKKYIEFAYGCTSPYGDH